MAGPVPALLCRHQVLISSQITIYINNPYFILLVVIFLRENMHLSMSRHSQSFPSIFLFLLVSSFRFRLPVGKVVKSHWLKENGVNSNSYGRFMKLKGPLCAFFIAGLFFSLGIFFL